MAVPRFSISKHTNDRLDYTVDWSDWLDGMTIAASSWTVPSGLTGASESNTTTSATIVISGGSGNRQYQIQNTITTSTGLQKVATIELSVQ